ncbi:MAG: hypothetical protein WC949_00925 [Candidatus Paceibacterota bacterium]
MAKINGGGNKFLFIAFALALVVIAGVFCLSKGNPLVGAYAKTNNENSGEVHTLTIKDGNHFTKYDNYGGAKNYGFAQTQDAVLENAGTYTKQDKDIDFEWTDSSTKAGQHLSCTVVDEGLDCGITSKDIYRKQK